MHASSRLKIVGALALLFVIPGSAFGQESLFGSYFKTVTLKTKGSGASLSKDLVNFPLLVRLNAENATDIFSQASMSGGDLRVINAAGTTPLSFEVESWNATEKSASIWVRVPLIRAADSTTAFRLYWGRQGAVSNSDPAGVFDTANGFQAVWHLNSHEGDERDATLNGFTATAINGPTDTLGAMGASRRFNGIDQRFTVANSASGKLNFQLTDSYTLSVWVYPTALTSTKNQGNQILDKGDNQYTLNAYGTDVVKYWDLFAKLNNGSATYMQCYSTEPAISATASIGSWHYLTGTFRGAPIGTAVVESLYVDGVPVAGASETPTSATLSRTTTLNVGLGALAGGTGGTTFTRFWNGMLDEVRISNVARPAEWIALEYLTQKPGSSLVTLGASSGTAIAHRGNSAGESEPAFRIERTGNRWMFRIERAGATRAFLELTDVRGHAVWQAETDLSDSRSVSWNPDQTSPGIYFLRVEFRDESGKTLAVLSRKLPLAP